MKSVELNNPIPIEGLTNEQYIPKYIEITVKKNSIDDNFSDNLCKKINDEKVCIKIENIDFNTYRFYKGFLKRKGNTYIYEPEKID